MIKLNTEYLENFITQKDMDLFQEKLEIAHKKLYSKESDCADMRGWMNIPQNICGAKLEKIRKAAKKIKQQSDVLLIIGIGGSYLGARAVVEFLKSNNYNYLKKDTPDVFFIGNNISSAAIEEMLEICKHKDVSVNVVSKSGTTTECAIAFRIFKKFLEDKYGKSGARERIYCTTDPSKGCLRDIALEEGYELFEIPADVGGRYSVFTAVGLLPLEVIGANTDAVLNGVKDAEKNFCSLNLDENDCYKYAVLRNIFHKKGKIIEILAGYEPRFEQLFLWWRQLFAESEGKCGKGIFPSMVTFSSDLHSMGQFIQEGTPVFFETVLNLKNDSHEMVIPKNSNNIDGLGYLSGKSVDYVNKAAFKATVLAHTQGGTPNIILDIDRADEYNLGYLIYFFEKSCAVSAYILGVNPFTQPGVEKYKKNMFSILGKPGI